MAVLFERGVLHSSAMALTMFRGRFSHRNDGGSSWGKFLVLYNNGPDPDHVLQSFLASKTEYR